MSLHSRRGLTSKLSSKKYRDAFVAARISQTLAIQLRVLRQRAGLSQPELARELGTSQNAVSRMESPKYGKHSSSTLKKLAAYYDVGLIIRFAPFSEIMDWTLGLKEESVAVPDFAHDRLEEELDSMLADKRRASSHCLAADEAMDIPHSVVPHRRFSAAAQAGPEWPTQSSEDVLTRRKPAGTAMAVLSEQRVNG